MHASYLRMLCTFSSWYIKHPVCLSTSGGKWWILKDTAISPTLIPSEKKDKVQKLTYGYQPQKQPKKRLNLLSITKTTTTTCTSTIITFVWCICVENLHSLVALWRSEDNSVESILSTFPGLLRIELMSSCLFRHSLHFSGHRVAGSKL